MENKRVYGAKLNENLLVKNVPMVLACSHEFQGIGARGPDEIALLKKLRQNEEIDELLPKTQTQRTKDLNLKPLLLILGHVMQDENIRNPLFKEGLSEILRHGVHHLNMMIDVAMEINAIARTGRSVKKLGWKAVESVVHFQQFFVQGLWSTDDPMLQLAGMDVDEIKKYRKQLKTHQIPDGRIDTFCRLTPEQRAKLNLFDGDKAKNIELEKMIKVMPLITVTSKVEVEGETTMTASDIISIKIEVKYDNLPEKQGPGYVVSQAYPFLKKHQWHIIVTDAQTRENIVQAERIHAEDDNVAKFEMKQRFGRVGLFQFHVFIVNDSFIGFDKEIDIDIDVKKDDPDRVIEDYAKEDQDAAKGPSMVQSMLTAEASDDDDESSDDNHEVLFKKLEAANIKTPEAQKFNEQQKQQANKKEKKEAAKAGKSELVESD